MGSEIVAVEDRWAGKFGTSYTLRNPKKSPERQEWWAGFLNTFKLSNALEVGCNLGLNVRYICDKIPTWGVDVNEEALWIARWHCRQASLGFASGYDLPFKDNQFSLVFTSGVLIHQPPETVHGMMEEVVRCSGDLVMSMEYEAPTFEEIPYRGETRALWRGPFTKMYEDMGCEMIASGELGKDQGWDDVVWSVLQCPNSNPK